MQEKAEESSGRLGNPLLRCATTAPPSRNARIRVAGATEAAASARGQQWRVPWELILQPRRFLLLRAAGLCSRVSGAGDLLAADPGADQGTVVHGHLAAMGVGLASLLGGLVLRSVIMGRWVTSVVTNLYETILFNTAFVVVSGSSRNGSRAKNSPASHCRAGRRRHVPRHEIDYGKAPTRWNRCRPC